MEDREEPWIVDQTDYQNNRSSMHQLVCFFWVTIASGRKETIHCQTHSGVGVVPLLLLCSPLGHTSNKCKKKRTATRE